MTLNAKDGLRVCQLQSARSISCLQLTYHVTLARFTLAKEFLSWNISIHSYFTRRGQSRLDSQLTTTSTWLHPETFRHWIRNPGSLVPKYSELLASHCCDLRFEEHICPYLLETSLDSRVFRVGSRSARMYTYISPVCYTSISILFGKWGQPTHIAHNDLLWYYYYPVIEYHPVVNSFRTSKINPLFII